MNASLKAPLTLGFILAIPLFAIPAHSAPVHKTGHQPAHDRVADFAKANALVSPAAPVARSRETDGLSRNDEDCNMGCIDH
jgi:hypothetical protein